MVFLKRLVIKLFYHFIWILVWIWDIFEYKQEDSVKKIEGKVSKQKQNIFCRLFFVNSL